MTTDKPHWNSKAGRHATYVKRRARVLEAAHIKYHENAAAYAAKEQEKRAKYKARNPSKYMSLHIRSRAKRAGIEYTITPEDIRIPDVCPILGTPLEFGNNKCKANSPTLDRKDNTKGYTPDNVWVISHRANTMKGNSTMEELRTFCLSCLEHMQSGELVEVVASQGGSRSRWDQAVRINRGTSSIIEGVH